MIASLIDLTHCFIYWKEILVNARLTELSSIESTYLNVSSYYVNEKRLLERMGKPQLYVNYLSPTSSGKWTSTVQPLSL